jgi:hypothetical protein
MPPRRHGVAVGHRHHGNFLQAEDVLEAVVSHQRIVERQLGRAGIAEEIAHAELREEIKQRFDAGERHEKKCGMRNGKRKTLPM